MKKKILLVSEAVGVDFRVGAENLSVDVLAVVDVGLGGVGLGLDGLHGGVHGDIGDDGDYRDYWGDVHCGGGPGEVAVTRTGEGGGASGAHAESQYLEIF